MKQESRPVRQIVLAPVFEGRHRPFPLVDPLLLEEESVTEETKDPEKKELPEDVNSEPEKEDSYDSEDDGISFHPYVFTVDENRSVSASVELAPKLMVVSARTAPASEAQNGTAEKTEEAGAPDELNGNNTPAAVNENAQNGFRKTRAAAIPDESEDNSSAVNITKQNTEKTDANGGTAGVAEQNTTRADNVTVLSIPGSGEIIPIDSDTIVKELAEKDVNYSYNGESHQPAVNVYLRDTLEKLVEDEDYTVSYGENVNAGPGTITIAGKGK